MTGEPVVPVQLDGGVARGAAAMDPVVPVQLDGVVARDAAGPRGGARGTLHGVTAALGPGVNVFLGAPEDGTVALCDAIAGARRVLRGSVRVAGEDPWSSPAVRGRVGALLAAPDLPDAASVRACVGQALAAMGGAAAEADGVLAELGLGGLAARRTAALSFAEARAVELSLAVAAARRAPAPAVAVLFEPCGDVAVPGGAAAVDAAVAGLRAAGACVVLATSSAADARRLADVLWVLSRGALVRRELDGKALAVGDAEVAAWVGAGGGAGAAVRVLAAAVAESAAVRSAFWEDPAQPDRPAVLRVRGPDRDACALAVLDAAANAGVAVEAITSSVPDLAHVRSAALARYQQAQAQMAARAQAAAAAAAAQAAGGRSGSASVSTVAVAGASGSPAATDPGASGVPGSPAATDPGALGASGSPTATETGTPGHPGAPPEAENRSFGGSAEPPGARFGPSGAPGKEGSTDPGAERASGSPGATDFGAPRAPGSPAGRDGSPGGGPS